MGNNRRAIGTSHLGAVPSGYPANSGGRSKDNGIPPTRVNQEQKPKTPIPIQHSSELRFLAEKVLERFPVLVSVPKKELDPEQRKYDKKKAAKRR